MKIAYKPQQIKECFTEDKTVKEYICKECDDEFYHIVLKKLDLIKLRM